MNALRTTASTSKRHVPAASHLHAVLPITKIGLLKAFLTLGGQMSPAPACGKLNVAKYDGHNQFCSSTFVNVSRYPTYCKHRDKAHVHVHLFAPDVLSSPWSKSLPVHWQVEHICKKRLPIQRTINLASTSMPIPASRFMTEVVRAHPSESKLCTLALATNEDYRFCEDRSAICGKARLTFG